MATKKISVKKVKKIVNKSAVIRKYLALNKLSVNQIAEKLKVEPSYVYQIRWTDRKKAEKAGNGNVGSHGLGDLLGTSTEASVGAVKSILVQMLRAETEKLINQLGQ